MNMPYLDINDMKMYFEIFGSEFKLEDDGISKKPTILILHGGPGVDHIYYEVPFWESLQDAAQLIFIDHRGNGRSTDENPAGWNLAQWAADAREFIHKLGLEKPVIAGGSMGGWVALQLAKTTPNIAGGYIFIDTEAHLKIPAIIEAFENCAGKEIRDIVEAYFTNPTPEIEEAFFTSCLPFCAVNSFPAAWLNRTILSPEVGKYFYAERKTFDFRDSLMIIANGQMKGGPKFVNYSNYRVIPRSYQSKAYMISSQ
jgi:pimeloyl-ACP methyl ester carboxylesterase